LNKRFKINLTTKNTKNTKKEIKKIEMEHRYTLIILINTDHENKIKRNT